MAYYAGLRKERVKSEFGGDEGARQRTVGHLLKLRQAFQANPPAAAPDEVGVSAPPPSRSLNDTLLLGTWNIREFDSEKYGRRVPEAFFYIAEIIDHFDIVAVQEVRDDLYALDRVMDLLGSHWSYLATDTNVEAPGNGERIAIVYDTRKVKHLGVSGELVLPPVKTKQPDGTFESTPARQVARTPLVAWFQSAWTKFTLASVHILWGEDRDDSPPRVEEIRSLAKLLRKRSEAAADGTGSDEWANLIILGDFNIFRPDSEAMRALTEDGGFDIPPQIQALPPSNVPNKDRHYDQIGVRTTQERFALTGRAGVFDFTDVLFRDDEEAVYAPLMGDGYASAGSAKKQTNYYRQWRTFQMSDHLPMWVELRVNFADDYLTGLVS